MLEMKRVISQIVAPIFLLPALSACPDDAIYVTKEIAPGMLVDARIESSIKRLGPGEVKVFGNLLIENSSDWTFRYSNSQLWLNVDDTLSHRTYVDSVASRVVDFDFVDISPKDQLRLEAYWILPESIGSSLDECHVALELATP
jgi:hypothetical protein